MLTKKTLAIGAIATMLGAGAVGVGTTYAAQTAGMHANMGQELATAIANKFGLNVADVQAVIDQQVQSHHQAIIEKHDQTFDAMIAQAVTDGKLTQSQADAITLKRKEIESYAQSLKNESPDQRKADMKAKIAELKTWAEQNNIPAQYIRFSLPNRGGMMGHMHGMMGGQHNTSGSSS